MTTPLGNLVRTPLTNFKDLGGQKGSLVSHSLHQYHIRAVQASKDFISTYQNPQLEVANQVSSQRLKTIQENRERLRPIVKSIIFCGRNNIPLRGSHDDGPVELSNESQFKGTFREILKFREDSGDTLLAEQLKNSSARATYVSKTTQTELINCCSLEISEEILKRVRAANKESTLTVTLRFA